MSVQSIIPYTIADNKSMRREYVRQSALNVTVLANLNTQLIRALGEDKPLILHRIQQVEETQIAIQTRLVQLNRELDKLKKEYPSQYACSLD
jgi:hypothetical protein